MEASTDKKSNERTAFSSDSSSSSSSTRFICSRCGGEFEPGAGHAISGGGGWMALRCLLCDPTGRLARAAAGAHIRRAERRQAVRS